MSVQTRLTWFVSVLLLVVVLAMGFTVYQVVANELSRIADFQLQGHVASVSKQVGVLLQTTDSQEFVQDMHYDLQGERRQLQTIGWNVQSDLFNSDDTSALGQVDHNLVTKDLLQQMRKMKTGVLHIGSGPSAMTYAFQFIPERSLLYVAAVSDSEILAPLNNVRNVTLLVVVSAFLVGFVGTWLFARRIVKPLVAIQAMMQAVAAGDLTKTMPRFRGMREIALLGDAVNEMIEQLRGLIGQANETARQVNHSSGELLHSAEQTAEGIRQVAATVQEVAGVVDAQAQGAIRNAAALEEMSGGLQRIVDTSGTVVQAAVGAAQEADQGNRSIQKAVAQMNSISTKVERIAAAIRLLDQRSGEVGKIVEVIGGIAEQTSLLALNAAIEAARAGEQGRGFAVVADEVRKLAEQSERSAHQIADLIREIQQDTALAVHVMSEGTQEVQAGLAVVDEAGTAFQRIWQQADDVALQVQEISTASQQMFVNSQQVIVSVEELTESSQKSAASSQFCAVASVEQLESMEEVFASVDALSRMAQELQLAIERFQV